MATNVDLTPDLERFARECVDGGRYSNVSEVVHAALRLLQDAEARRQAFGRMLKEIEEETARNGAFALESVMAEVDEIIAATANRRSVETGRRHAVTVMVGQRRCGGHAVDGVLCGRSMRLNRPAVCYSEE